MSKVNNFGHVLNQLKGRKINDKIKLKNKRMLVIMLVIKIKCVHCQNKEVVKMGFKKIRSEKTVC